MYEPKRISDILPLGDPRLYEVCEAVTKEELPQVSFWVADLHNVMEGVRKKYGFGRGIAAPQLGIMKRLFYLNIDEPQVIINPEISDHSEEKYELWDDCMCFPNLLVKVQRHKSIKMKYLNAHWAEQSLEASGDMSELIQHEFDHLNGVLCTMRSIDDKSFKWRRI